MERHCLTKQEQYVTPPSIIPFNIDSDMWRVLSVINPAYRAMSEVIPRLIIAGMVHPERMAIIGMRYSDDDLTDDQLGLHSFLSPGFIHYYHIHQIITRYRDMNSYLASELSRMHDDEWVLADGPLGIVTRSDGFDDAMKRHRLTWKDLQGFIQSSMHREAAGLFTAVECSHGTPGSPPLTLRLQPVYVEKRKYLRITLSESATAIPLTPREREIYHLLCKGLTNRSIGEILSISTETVKRHLANIFEKTGARNRTELSHMKL
ncbi:MAG: hypothetical protein JXA20_07235 [Spirochaetes bacterium]|nr:hypothetical protein [Spirochaetota bacterium]